MAFQEDEDLPPAGPPVVCLRAANLHRCCAFPAPAFVCVCVRACVCVWAATIPRAGVGGGREREREREREEESSIRVAVGIQNTTTQQPFLFKRRAACAPSWARCPMVVIQVLGFGNYSGWASRCIGHTASQIIVVHYYTCFTRARTSLS